MANVIVGGVEQATLEQEFKNAANEDGQITVSLTAFQIVYGAAGVGVEGSRILEKMREKKLVEGHCLELADFLDFSRSLGSCSEKPEVLPGAGQSTAAGGSCSEKAEVPTGAAQGSAPAGCSHGTT